MGQIFLYFHQLVHFNFATKYFNNVMFLFIYMQKKPCLQNKIATVRQNPELYFLKSLAHCRLVVKS